ncbi:quinol monooxygenase YgiN [Paraburkholderia sp. MM5496-R1]
MRPFGRRAWHCSAGRILARRAGAAPVRVIERWESQDALAAHAKSAHIQAYKKAAADWIEHAEIRVVSKIA